MIVKGEFFKQLPTDSIPKSFSKFIKLPLGEGRGVKSLQRRNITILTNVLHFVHVLHLVRVNSILNK